MSDGRTVSPRGLRWMATAFALVALLGLAVFAHDRPRTQALLRDGIRVPGEITRMVDVRSAVDPVVTHAPEFAFITPEGVRHVRVSPLSSGSPGFTAGQRIAVIYPRGHPEAARIVTPEQVWITSWIALYIALVSGLTALGLFWLAHRQTRRDG